ncbi:MAG TPA: tagatose 1,6-diphosphate aldolase [Actinomycetaceae bacterium]|nr:tagatose 1,6-diphosphate aldolase [Actinomycetaceae bacterium]
MTTTDLGKLRSLASCVDDAGFFTVLAVDHPAAMILGRTGTELANDPASIARAVQAKFELTRALAPYASALLTDPALGLAGAVATGALPGGKGLILNSETEDYQHVANAHVSTDLRERWGARKIRLAGGDGLKLLWRYRHDVPEAAAHRDLVRRIADDCAAASLPLIVEPIWVPLEGESLEDPEVRSRRVRGVVDYAILAQELGADIVKTEFPGWVDTEEEQGIGAAACAEIDAAVDVPWLLLSAGVTFEQFLTQTEIAAAAGSSGFIAGRAVWGAAASEDAESRAAGTAVAIERLTRLTAAVHDHGRPWRLSGDGTTVLRDYPQNWYENWHENWR